MADAIPIGCPHRPHCCGCATGSALYGDFQGCATTCHAVKVANDSWRLASLGSLIAARMAPCLCVLSCATAVCCTSSFTRSLGIPVTFLTILLVCLKTRVHECIEHVEPHIKMTLLSFVICCSWERRPRCTLEVLPWAVPLRTPSTSAGSPLALERSLAAGKATVQKASASTLKLGHLRQWVPEAHILHLWRLLLPICVDC